jgi:hypothetical protein
MLHRKGWFCKITHGSIYQAGFPDVFATHKRHGHRWIEAKTPDRRGDVFTSAQLEVFPKLCANGSGVWVLTAATDGEYAKLFCPANWAMYLQVFANPSFRG